MISPIKNTNITLKFNNSEINGLNFNIVSTDKNPELIINNHEKNDIKIMLTSSKINQITLASIQNHSILDSNFSLIKQYVWTQTETISLKITFQTEESCQFQIFQCAKNIDTLCSTIIYKYVSYKQSSGETHSSLANFDSSNDNQENADIEVSSEHIPADSRTSTKNNESVLRKRITRSTNSHATEPKQKKPAPEPSRTESNEDESTTSSDQEDCYSQRSASLQERSSSDSSEDITFKNLIFFSGPERKVSKTPNPFSNDKKTINLVQKIFYFEFTVNQPTTISFEFNKEQQAIFEHGVSEKDSFVACMPRHLTPTKSLSLNVNKKRKVFYCLKPKSKSKAKDNSSIITLTIKCGNEIFATYALLSIFNNNSLLGELTKETSKATKRILSQFQGYKSLHNPAE